MSSLPSLEQLHAIGAKQQPSYDDPAALAAAVARLRTLPPLVFAGECDELKAKIAAASRGEAFLLQGGDCAETFVDATADNTRNKLRVLLQMAVVLTYAASVPVVKLGRLAGQYAKPRSSDEETRDGVTLPAYRGDAVNGYDFTPEARVPDPQRLVDVYNNSAATLNLVRAFVTGGYADLRQVHTWNTDFVQSSPFGQRYEPVDSELLLSYRESKSGQLLEEGITEAGSMASFQAAATAYATHGVPTIPFYVFYSMFGFQRVGDQIGRAHV